MQNARGTGENTDLIDEIYSYLEKFYKIIPNGSVNIDSEEDISFGVSNILEEISKLIENSLSVYLSFFALVFGVGIFMALAESFSLKENKNLTLIGVNSIGVIIIYTRLAPIMNTVTDSLAGISDFLVSTVPILSAVNASGGGINSSLYLTANMSITLAAVDRLSKGVFIPLVTAQLAISLFSPFEADIIGCVSKNIKGFLSWCIGIITVVVLSATSAGGVIAAAKDTAYLKLARYTAQSMLPGVGGMVGGSLGGLFTSVRYIGGMIGGAGCAVIISIALSPLILLLMYRMAMGLAVMFLEYTGSNGGVRCFSAIKSALDGLISIYVMSIIIYIFQLTVFVRMGAEIFG